MFSFSSALPTVGDHGYYNSLPSMHPFMAATGPSFHVGLRTSGLHSVDLYPLMCHLLAIPPRPHNGSLEAAKCLLAAEVCSRLPQVTALMLGIFLLLTLVAIGESRPRLESFRGFEPLVNNLPFLLVLFQLFRERRQSGVHIYQSLRTQDLDSNLLNM